jgi:hypothetical protein
MRINQLTEAKFKKPIVMYHGTSSEFLSSILKHGMIPNPKKKKWDTDPDVSLTTQSRASLEGSYWTSNLLTATSSGSNTTNKFGGETILIIANIQTGSAKADEDNVTYELKYQYDKAFGGSYSSNPKLVADVYYDSKEYYDKAKDKFITNVHNNLKDNPNQPQPSELLSDIFDASTLRIIAHGIADAKGDEYWSPIYRVKNKPTIPPTVSETENNLLMLKDKLTRYYRSSASNKNVDQFSHTLRITEPITFSGANRITHILKIPKSYFDENKKYIQPPLVLLYGNKNIPEKFLKDYTSRIGKFPGLVNKTNEILLNPVQEI